MLHAPDTAMFTAARLWCWYTVAPSGSLPKGVQVYDAGLAQDREACMFTVCVSQQHWWSDLLLAVMLCDGVNVQRVVAPVPAGIQTHQLLLALELPSGRQLPDPSFY